MYESEFVQPYWRIKRKNEGTDSRWHEARYVVGKCAHKVDGEKGMEFMHLHKVLYLPGLSVNMLSMQRLAMKNVFPFYQEVKGKVVLRRQENGNKKEQVALMTIDQNGRSTLDCKVMKPEYGKDDALQISIERLHERMGHA